MINKTKGRAGWHQATPNISKYIFYFTVITTCLKAAIVTLSFLGRLPMSLAKWINNHGGQHDD